MVFSCYDNFLGFILVLFNHIMDKGSLKLHFGGKVVDIEVDTDKTLLMDVLNKLVDKAGPKGIKLPKPPSVSYTDKKKKI